MPCCNWQVYCFPWRWKVEPSYIKHLICTETKVRLMFRRYLTAARCQGWNPNFAGERSFYDIDEEVLAMKQRKHVIPTAHAASNSRRSKKVCNHVQWRLWHGRRHGDEPSDGGIWSCLWRSVTCLSIVPIGFAFMYSRSADAMLFSYCVCPEIVQPPRQRCGVLLGIWSLKTGRSECSAGFWSRASRERDSRLDRDTGI